MNEQELKHLWQQQVIQAPTQESGDKLAERMRQKTRQLNRTLLLRDGREWIACIAIVLWFGADLRHNNPTLTQIGNVVLVLSALIIGVRLLAARRVKRVFLHPPSVTEFLSSELNNINHQIRLLQTVLWWYLLPIFSGAFLVVIGPQTGSKSGGRLTSDMLWEDTIVLLTFALLSYFLHWINQRAVRTQLSPIKDELAQFLHDIDSSHLKAENP